ncbi:MAG: EAL domain-containing protein [Lachnospiraceae bacterium]
MGSNAFFDIAALINVLLILFTLYLRYQNPSAENVMLRALVWVSVISIGLDLLVVFAETNPYLFYLPILYMIEWFYFLFRNALMILYIVYLITITDTTYVLKDGTIYTLGAVIITDVLVFLLSIFNKCIFYFDERRIYHRGSALWILYVTTLICCVFSILYIKKYGKGIDKSRRISLYLFPIIPIITSVIQLFFPQLVVEAYGVSISLMWLFFHIAKPEQLLESKTGALNKSTFASDVSKVLFAGRKAYIIGVAICDFELFRRSYGFKLTQVYLRQITVYLQHLSRRHRVYYIGKGHFCIMMEQKYIEATEAEASIINQRFMEKWTWEDLSINIETAITSMEVKNPISNVDQVFDYMDCLSEKDNSQIKGVYPITALDITNQQRTADIERAIDIALSQGTLQVYYQPIYDTQEKSIVAAEALVRMFDEKLGMVSPEEFIPIAEQSGKIIKIGNFVFREVCKFILQEQIYKRGIQYIEVNLSVVECMQAEMASQLLQVIEEYHIDSNQVNFEITETAAASNIEMLSINMHKLFNHGIRFSLDDYGTGYSNISYMLDLPFQIVKIDKSILWSSFNNPKAMIAMHSSIRMIQDMGMKIVVEGVETKEMVDKLEELGCDYLQGYYFAKPLPPNQFVAML